MRRVSQFLVYPPIVSCIDLFLILAGFQVAAMLHAAPAGTIAWRQTLPFILLTTLVIFKLFDLYGNWLERPISQLAYFLMSAVSAIGLITWLVESWQQTALTLQRTTEAAAIQFALLFLYRAALRRAYWSTAGCERVLVIAEEEDQALALIRKLEASAPAWMQFVGFLTARDLETLDQSSRTFDTILVAPDYHDTRSLLQKCTELHKKVLAIPAALEVSLLGAQTIEVQDMLLLRLQRARLTPGQQATKRAVDILLSSSLLLAFAPLLLITAALVRLTSRGPAIFQQERVGRYGASFLLYKFRTMIADAETQTGPVLAQHADPRITRLGLFLRASRIDELPQLFNVLLGTMSMIGPRPERQFFVSKFRETVSDYDLRLSVKPGITGLAQVAGSYSTPFDQKLKFDLLYIYDYSFMCDISILLRTILVVFQGDRAAGVKASPIALIPEER